MMAAAVAAMTLGELLGSAAGIHAPLAITDLVSDSRQVTPGAAFVALAGATTHGLEHAPAALAAGASIVLYEADQQPATGEAAGKGTSSRAIGQPRARGQGSPDIAPSLAVTGLRAQLGDLGRRFYGRSSRVRTLIGVTGTNGKTTVAYLVAQALGELGRPCGYIGTLGYGRPDTLVEHALTTPDCLTLHRELAGIDGTAAAVEVSSHALAQDRIAGLDFDVAAFTNLTRDHLDWHSSMDSYFAAKARLFAVPTLGAAVVNVQDEHGATIVQRLAPRVRPIRTALVAEAATLSAALAGAPAGTDLVGAVERHGLAGIKVHVGGALGRTEIASPLIGDFNADNLLLALGVLVACDAELESAAAALGRCVAPPGRMEVFGGGAGQPWVVVDYAHTPDALDRVLRVLHELTARDSGEITCVFGCGGQRDRGKRAPMGRVAAARADHIVLTDDNPRGEDPGAIIADIAAGIADHPDVRTQHARELAIATAIGAAGPGDVVLIAGKGHEHTQTTGNRKREFDDRSQVRSVLRGAS